MQATNAFRYLILVRELNENWVLKQACWFASDFFVAKALPKLEEWEHNLVEGKPTWMRDIDGDKRPELAADGR